jgi:hypothetical protein
MIVAGKNKVVNDKIKFVEKRIYIGEIFVLNY